ncbi:2Fe-2S iron-sulfur cluster-binding protein [soil metagenome]
MPKLTVNGRTTDFSEDTRLVLATEEMGMAIGHRCGGKARCTTCRVEFVSGEPAEMTRAEYEKLSERGLLGQVRLSCQLTVSQDMEVVPLQTKESEGWPDTGPAPAPEVEP